MNPYNDLYDIFNRFSGYLMYVKGEGSFRFNNQNVSPFAWLHPFFYDIVTKTDSIGLDATFRLLKPFKVCISQCIIQNAGVPLGILVADSKSFEFYSLLFELLNKIDPSGKLFQLFQEKTYITDEHKCFDKLKTVYKLTIYKCFTHLIRSVGSASVLGLLLRDILFSYTKEEFESNRLRNTHILQYLYNNDPKKDDARYTKVSKVLGYDIKGNPCPIDESYSHYILGSTKKYQLQTTIQKHTIPKLIQ